MDMNQMPMGAAPQPQQKASGLSIASMVCGIVAVVLYYCNFYVSIVLGLVAIVLAAVSMKKQAGGKGMAIAGLVCGIVAIVPSVISLVFCASVTAELNSLANMM